MVLEDVCELIADCPHTTAPDEGKDIHLFEHRMLVKVDFCLKVYIGFRRIYMIKEI